MKSMRAQVRPITTVRTPWAPDRAQQLMRENKIDGILLAGGTHGSPISPAFRWK